MSLSGSHQKHGTSKWPVFMMYSPFPHLVPLSRNTDALQKAALFSPGPVLEGNRPSWTISLPCSRCGRLGCSPTSTAPYLTKSLHCRHCSATSPCTFRIAIQLVTGNQWEIWLRTLLVGRLSIRHVKCWSSTSKSPSQDSSVPSIRKTLPPPAPCTASLSTWVQWTTLKLLESSFSLVWCNGHGEQMYLQIFIEWTHSHTVL